MSVKYTRLGDGRVLATIRVQCPYTKRWTRERRKFQTKAKAKLFAEPRERHLATVLAVQPALRPQVPPTRPGRPQRAGGLCSPRIQDWQSDFLDLQQVRGRKPSWVSSQKQILERHIIPVIGSMRIEEIDQAALDQVLARARAKYQLKTNTRRNIGHVVKRLCTAAVELGLIETAPRLVLPKQEVPEMSFYRLSEYERLVSAAKELDERIYAMVLLAGEAGLRCGEIVGLEGGDLNFSENGWIAVRRQERRGVVSSPKWGSTRSIPMTKRVRRALKAIQNLPGARVMLRDSGEPVSETVLLHWLKKAQKRAGLLQFTGSGKTRRVCPGQGLHKLRHTFGTFTVKAMDLRQVQTLMGHRNLATTQRYLHVDDEGLVEGVGAFGELLESAAG